MSIEEWRGEVTNCLLMSRTDSVWKPLLDLKKEISDMENRMVERMTQWDRDIAGVEQDVSSVQTELSTLQSDHFSFQRSVDRASDRERSRHREPPSAIRKLETDLAAIKAQVRLLTHAVLQEEP